MSLKVAVQMDPIAAIKVAGDTTFALLLEAQSAGMSCTITRLITFPCAMGRSWPGCRF